MTRLSTLPVTHKWPPRHPERIQLYAGGTPNGIKVSVMLEECELPYEAHTVSLAAREQFSPEFLALNPNNKIPALIDPDGPQGRPLALWESGAILLYLAQKADRLLPEGGARYEAIQWLMWQVGGLGPMLGQVGFFHHFAGKEWEDKRPLARYVTEARRLLGVLDARLAPREWLLDAGYSVADVSVFPWVRTLISYYDAAELVAFDDYPHVARALAAFEARAAVQRGIQCWA